MVTLEKLVKTGALGLLLGGCETIELTGPIPEVVISPTKPNAHDNLRCKVKEYEDTPFEFYWYAGRALLFAETGYESTLNKGYIRSGDLIACEAWSPASDLYSATPIGFDRVYIK